MTATLPPFQPAPANPAENAPNHERTSGETWWGCTVLAHMGPWFHDHLKISTPTGKTRLISAVKVPEYCCGLESKKLKIYASYSTLRGGMKEKHVDYSLLRVIDLDGMASDADLETISRMFPDCPLIRSNGIQVFLHSTNDWEQDAPALAILGEEAQKRSNLTYDRSCHLRKDGTAGDHQSHAYRVPFGWSHERNCAVEAYLPLSNGTCTPQEALKDLGLKVPKAKKGAITVLSRNQSKEGSKSVSTRRTIRLPRESKNGSLSSNYSEFSEILKTRVALMKKGLTRSQAEDQILKTEWLYHPPEALRIALTQRPAWVGKGRDGKPLTPCKLKSLEKDFSVYHVYLTKFITSTQRYYQEAWALAAHRAWSLNIFYEMEMDGERCVDAFFSWPGFSTLRDLSLEALPRQAIEDDIRCCWAKFYGYKQQQVKEVSVRVLKEAIKSLKKKEFKGSDLKVPEIKSLRQLQKALKVLCDEDFLEKLGSGRWTKYRVK